jgi:hypothetical protein
VEIACERAMAVGARSYRFIDTMLKNKIDQVPSVTQTELPRRDEHEHVRGCAYYDQNQEESNCSKSLR